MTGQSTLFACSRCGGPAIVQDASLDPARPLGRCNPPDPHRKGCGRVILVSDPAERLAIQIAYHRRAMTAQHHHHDPDHRTSASCDKCVAAGWVTARTDPGTMTAGA